MSVALQPVSDGLPGIFLAMIVLVGLLVLVPAWVLLSRSRAVSTEGASASDAQRIPILYGYTVCLVCIIVALTSTATLFDNALRRRAPLVAQTEWSNPYEVSLSSFEAYQATVGRAAALSAPDAPQVADSVPQAVLRTRYEALRADRIAAVEALTYRKLASSTALLLVSTGLFAAHWRWIRSRAGGR